MMIMAQHPQQQQQQPHLQQSIVHQNGRQKQYQAATAATVTQHNAHSFQSPIKAASNATGLLQHQQEQDGKRTLIKNQLYLIEQLQLENANLRNERDQLQLENEELKFQLQMISSSNILNQPGAAFNNQQLERLVESNDEKINYPTPIASANLRSVPCNGNGGGANSNQQQQLTAANQYSQQANQQQQVKLLITPLRHQPLKHNGDGQQVLSATNQEQQTALVRSSALADGTRQSASGAETTTTVIPLNSAPSAAATTVQAAPRTSKLLSGKSTSLAGLNVDPSAVRSTNQVPQSRDLPHDDEEQQVKMVEQRYGGNSEQVQAAAVVIQRAFRKYQICKRFRTITEQLRHTHQTSSSSGQQQPVERKREQRHQSIAPTSAKTATKATAEIPFVSGTTRAAAWESLSYAASRLAAAGAARPQATNTTGQPAKQPPSSQQQVASLITPPMTAPMVTAAVVQQSHSTNNRSNDVRLTQKQDPVVAAAINFQQLESIRKRQYRVGLNIFNKNPEKGVSFLVAHSFIDSSSPYLKNSTSYYHSNQLHFIDKQHLMQQQLQLQASSPTNIQNCHLCCEEENLKRNVAHFLLHRKGLAKERIGQYLGNLQSQFNQDVLKYYLQELDFYGLQIDLALRKFLSTFRLPGEAQKIERIVDRFAQRYVQCQQQPQQPQMTGNVSSTNVAQIHLVNQQHQPQQQQQLIPQQVQQQLQQSIHNNQQQQQAPLNYKNNLILLSKDEIFILTFAIIMLNTDLHSPSLKPTSRMSAAQFVNNLRGVFKSQTINESDLIEIYERVKANQITTLPDHVTHVMKVQQGLTVTNFQRKELPNLCVPHRRLVCFCRLFEVYDINKKERPGQHQREIFLFNDLLLVTKLARRVRANTTQLYTYRQSISLQGLYVQLFQSTHYNFGIKLCQRSNDETLIMFNARNELDQSRFVDDLGESIAEMDEMETIKTHNIIDSIHFKYLERLRRHSMMHNGSNENNQPANQTLEDNQPSKAGSKNCDTTTTTTTPAATANDKQTLASDERHKKRRDEAFELQSNAPSSTSITSSRGRSVHAKFSSMLNLSSAADGGGDTSDDSNSKQQNQTKPGLRQNQSFAQHTMTTTNQRVIDQSGGSSRSSGRTDQQQAALGATQRRCSTSSVHSLDSGLFLSRDVSPNQSS